jgi:hypothetical protein
MLHQPRLRLLHEASYAADYVVIFDENSTDAHIFSAMDNRLQRIRIRVIMYDKSYLRCISTDFAELWRKEVFLNVMRRTVLAGVYIR